MWGWHQRVEAGVDAEPLAMHRAPPIRECLVLMGAAARAEALL